jgi:hypothetical protein
MPSCLRNSQRFPTALYEAGHIILTQPLKGCTALKSWAMRLAKRAGMKKAIPRAS